MNDAISELAGRDRYPEAVAVVVATQKGSTSQIQRVLYIGYNQAARLVEQMEEDGIVSPPDNCGKRTVIWSRMFPLRAKAHSQ